MKSSEPGELPNIRVLIIRGHYSNSPLKITDAPAQGIRLIEDPLRSFSFSGNNPLLPPYYEKEVMDGVISMRPLLHDGTSIYLQSHGLIKDGQHTIALEAHTSTPTVDVLGRLAKAADRPIHVILGSCYGGAAAGAVGRMPAGSTLITLGPNDESIWSDMLSRCFEEATKAAIVGKEALDLGNPYAKFVHVLLVNPGMFCSFMPNFPGIKPFASRPPKQFSKDAILQHQRAEISRFAEYCHEITAQLSPEHARYVDTLVEQLRGDGIMGASQSWLYTPPEWASQLQEGCFKDMVALYFAAYYQEVKGLDHYVTNSHEERVAEGFAAAGVFPEGGNPIQHAMRTKNHVSLVRYLRQHPTFIADIVAKCSDKLLVAMVHEEPNLHTYTDQQGNSALSLAIAHKKSLFALAAIDAGANVDQKNAAGISPILSAVLSGQVHTALYLRERGASLADFPSDNGYSPEEVLVYNLRRAGGNLEVKRTNSVFEDSTPLGRAVHRGDELLIKALVKMGAAIESPDAGVSLTALGCAVCYRKASMVRVLAAAGADMNAEVRRGAGGPLRALFWPFSLDKEWKPVMHALLECGSRADHNLLRDLVMKGFAEPIALLKDTDLDMDAAVNKEGQTALGLAVLEGELEVIPALKMAGANMDAPVDKEGHTALGLAVLNNKPNVIPALKVAGANMDAALGSKGALTALRLAVLQGKPDTVDALLKAGATRMDEVADPHYTRGLLRMVLENKLAMLKVFLNASANTEHHIDNVAQALKMAEAAGHTEIVSLLVKERGRIQTVQPGSTQWQDSAATLQEGPSIASALVGPGGERGPKVSSRRV